MLEVDLDQGQSTFEIKYKREFDSLARQRITISLIVR